MRDLTYYLLSAVCIVAVLLGINSMSKVKTAVCGNGISAAAMVLAMVLIWITRSGAADGSVLLGLCLALAVGIIMGIIGAARAKMISMPQIIALLNGFGGAASALVAAVTAVNGNVPVFEAVTAGLALAIGVVFVMRVGGADMPITISLLNALSGVAGGIAGMAINEPLLVAIGGIVGASGLILTQDMCRAMNRKLLTILTGKTTTAVAAAKPAEEPAESVEPEKLTEEAVGACLKEAKKVIIVPGYGMALSQAQEDVARLAAALEGRGAEVKFAIHPVAGRMPGHMSVLLCEADIDYDSLFMMEDINEEFASCDIAIVIGANDVTNPAANTAEGTPIYGMPVLDVEKAPMAVFCNFDTKPGYAGVPNPLYDADNVLLMLGDAKESVQKLTDHLR